MQAIHGAFPYDFSVSTATIASACALSALSVWACISTPVAPIPSGLLGSWRGDSTGDLLEFAPGGIVVIELKDGATFVGRCVVDDEQLTIRYQLGASICPEEPGRYTLTLESGSLALASGVDTCADRERVLSQRWTRESQ